MKKKSPQLIDVTTEEKIDYEEVVIPKKYKSKHGETKFEIFDLDD